MSTETDNDELRPEYDFDFSKAVRGKHYQQYRQSSNIVVLDPDVAEIFHNSEEVNKALRSLAKSEHPSEAKRNSD